MTAQKRSRLVAQATIAHRMLSIRTLGSDAAEVKFYRRLEPLKTPKAKRSRLERLLF
jgi:hypothetical protein